MLAENIRQGPQVALKRRGPAMNRFCLFFLSLQKTFDR